jgi:outer membrane receptor protein involved in Fe transport
MPRTSRWLGLSFVTLLCVQPVAGQGMMPGPQAARDEKLGNLAALSLEQLLNIDIVTAAKHSQKLGEAPSTVTVITEDQIKQSAATTLAGLLKGVAGIDVLYASERKFAVSARGLSGGTYSKRVLFLVNGRPINQPSSGEGYVGYPISLADIKQVEIIRGPGSSLYGGNAFAGVVNIITKGPQDYAHTVEAQGSFGSYNRGNGSIALSRKLGKVGVVATATYLKFNEDGIWSKWYNDTSFPDYFKSYDLKARIEYKSLSLEGGYNHFTMPIAEKGQYTNATSYMRYEADHLSFAQAQWNPKLAANLNLNVKAYHNDFEIDKYDIYNAAGQVKDTQGVVVRSYAPGDRRWWKTPSDQTASGGGLQLDWVPVTNNRVIGGADYLRQHIDQSTLLSTSGQVDPSQAYYADKSLTATGIFVQDEQTLLAGRLTLTGGVRYDKYSEFERSFSPRLSAVLKFHQHGTLRATYGTAFRIPSLAEYYYSLYYYGRNNLDWKLEPETIHTYEVAVSYTFTQAQLSLTAAGFRNEVPNMIMNTSDRIEERFPMMYFYYNFDKQMVSQGVELEAEKRIGGHLLLRANYTYQRARDEDGNPMVEAPEHKLNVDAAASWGHFSAGATLTHVGSRFDRYYYTRYVDLTKTWVDHASTKLASYQAVDFRLAWRLRHNVTLAVTGQNLLDQKYFDTGHNGKYDAGYLSLDSKTQDYTKVNAPTNSYLNRDFLNPGRTFRVDLQTGF